MNAIQIPDYLSAHFYYHVKAYVATIQHPDTLVRWPGVPYPYLLEKAGMTLNDFLQIATSYAHDVVEGIAPEYEITLPQNSVRISSE